MQVCMYVLIRGRTAECLGPIRNDVGPILCTYICLAIGIFAIVSVQ